MSKKHADMVHVVQYGASCGFGNAEIRDALFEWNAELDEDDRVSAPTLRRAALKPEMLAKFLADGGDASLPMQYLDWVLERGFDAQEEPPKEIAPAQWRGVPAWVRARVAELEKATAAAQAVAAVILAADGPVAVQPRLAGDRETYRLPDWKFAFTLAGSRDPIEVSRTKDGSALTLRGLGFGGLIVLPRVSNEIEVRLA